MLSTTNLLVTNYSAMIPMLKAIGGLLAFLVPTDCLRSLENQPLFQRAFRQYVGNPEAICPFYDNARQQPDGNYACAFCLPEISNGFISSQAQNSDSQCLPLNLGPMAGYMKRVINPNFNSNFKHMHFKQKLVSVARHLHFSADQFDAIGIYEWPEIFKKIEAAFIIKENSNTKFNWWWESLKEDSFSLPIPRENTAACLQYLIPLQEKVFFIGCENDRAPSKFWLFEGQIEEILQVMDAVPSFEYYLVSKKYEWFLAMNHHDYLIGLGSMKDRLIQLSSSHHFQT